LSYLLNPFSISKDPRELAAELTLPKRVAALFAARREVQSVEVAHEVVLHNFWTAGSSDTGGFAQRPLDFTDGV
jgi:hypothetical protein